MDSVHIQGQEQTQTESGQQALTIQELEHLLWFSWLKASQWAKRQMVEQWAKTEQGPGAKKPPFKMHVSITIIDKLADVCIGWLTSHVMHPCMQGSPWQQPDMRLQAQMAGGVDAPHERHTGRDLLRRSALIFWFENRFKIFRIWYWRYQYFRIEPHITRTDIANHTASKWKQTNRDNLILMYRYVDPACSRLCPLIALPVRLFT